MSALGWIIVIVIVAAIFIALAASFYQRATNEVALVRTGLGGRRVVIDGGALAIPFFHEINRVNMQTLRMDVARSGEASLITKDRFFDQGIQNFIGFTSRIEEAVYIPVEANEIDEYMDNLHIHINSLPQNGIKKIQKEIT